MSLSVYLTICNSCGTIVSAYSEGSVERDRYICHQIMISKAGEVAQQMFCPESVEEHHARLDRLTVEALIQVWSRFAYQYQREEKMEELRHSTREVLENPLCMAAIHAVAKKLIERKELTGPEVDDIILKAMKQAAVEENLSGKNALRIKCPYCAGYEDSEC